MSDFLTGKPVAGKFQPERLDCEADEYHVGMPLAYKGLAEAEAGAGNTGNGTCTLLEANKDVAVGDHVLTFSAALVAELVGPDGKRESINITDGGAKAFNVGGLKFTITDGATAFVATDSFTITVDGSGAYAYDAANPEAIAWEDVTITTEKRVLCAVSGSEVLKSGIVDDSGDALTVTESMEKIALANGIVLRNV